MRISWQQPIREACFIYGLSFEWCRMRLFALSDLHDSYTHRVGLISAAPSGILSLMCRLNA